VTIRGPWIDDEPLAEVEHVQFPCVQVAARPWRSAEGTSHSNLRNIRVNIAILADYTTDRKLTTLHNIYTPVRDAIEDVAAINNAMDGNAFQECYVDGETGEEFDPYPMITLPLLTFVRKISS
jgi:hypothetical protein